MSLPAADAVYARRWPGFNMARIVKHKVKRWACRGYGFVSFVSERSGRAVIEHQRKGEETIDIKGRPVVLRASQWRGKLMTQDKMPEMLRIRAEKEKLVGEGKLLMEEIGRSSLTGRRKRQPKMRVEMIELEPDLAEEDSDDYRLVGLSVYLFDCFAKDKQVMNQPATS